MPDSKENAPPRADVDEKPTVSPKSEQTLSKPARKYAKVMLYTHPKVARKIKEIAFLEDRKANDVILDALDLYFASSGHTGIKHVIEH